MAKARSKKKNKVQALNIQGIVEQVDLQDLRLAGSKCHLLHLPGHSLPEQLHQNVTVQSAFNREEKEIACAITLSIAGGQAESKPEMPTLYIQAIIALRYSLQNCDKISEVEVKTFGQLNGVFNAWPYWREFVHSMTCRMGLPGLRIPLLKKAFEFTEESTKVDQDSVSIASKGLKKKR